MRDTSCDLSDTLWGLDYGLDYGLDFSVIKTAAFRQQTSPKLQEFVSLSV